MKICEILKIAKCKTPFEKREVEILLAEILQKNRAFLCAHPDFEISQNAAKKFFENLKKLQNSKPLAQILRRKIFCGFEFFIDENVLIPRDETEILVKKVCAFAAEFAKCEIVEIGAGSGCVAISLFLKLKNLQKNFQIFAGEISSKSLKIARKNAQKLNAEIKFFESNLLQNLPTEISSRPIFAANLPYIAANEILPKSVFDFEPHRALFGGKNGVEIYEKFLNEIAQKFPNFRAIFCEIDPQQKTFFEKFCKVNFPARRIEFFKDLNSKTRVVKIF